MVGRCGLAEDGRSMSGAGTGDPLVSVVIPMYQAEEWILETLASVAAQTYPLVETVVVDDGSSDRGADLVVEFAERAERPFRLVQTANKGVALARNLGIGKSNGELLAFLDADDLWHPSKLDLQVERIAETGAPMCTCGYEFFDDQRDRRVGLVRVKDGSLALRGWLALEGNGLALASTAVIRRQVLDDLHRFDPKFTVSADLDFALKIGELGQLDAVPDPLVRYRVHPGQMHRQISALAGDVSKLYDQVFSDREDPKFERRCRANLAVHLGLSQLLRGRIPLGLRQLGRSVLLDPRRIVTLPIRALARRTGRRLRSWFTVGVSW